MDKKVKKTVRVRFAPSPTGYLHIGGLRTALYNYLFAKKNKGELILRIEDTDRERFVEGAIENLIKTLGAVNLNFDEGPGIGGKYGPYIQSERLGRYKKYADELIKNKNAYYCFCTSERLQELRKKAEFEKTPTKYDRHCLTDELQAGAETRISNGEKYVIRMLMPQIESIQFNDLIRGNIVFPTKDVDDQVLIKSDGYPTYHLANVVDDYEMKITHVIRGDEWISSTPKHIVLYKAFGWEKEMPEFAHLPLLLNPDHTKLSKRQGDVSVESYLDNGYLPEALVNFVSLLGYNPKGDQEIYDVKELAKLFEITKINKGGAILNKEKLDWINHEYILKLKDNDFFEISKKYLSANDIDLNFFKDKDEKWLKIWCRMEKERAKTLKDIGIETKCVFKKSLSYAPQFLVWKKSNKMETIKALEQILDWVNESNDKDFNSPEAFETYILNKIESNGLGKGDVLWPLRFALTGEEKSPPPFIIAYLIGKPETRVRLEYAIKIAATI